MRFIFELKGKKKTTPKELNRLRRMMMSFEQTVNHVLPEFRVHLEEEK